MCWGGWDGWRDCQEVLVDGGRVAERPTTGAVSSIAPLQGERLEYHEYIALLKQSKLVLSPWGWGEWSHKVRQGGAWAGAQSGAPFGPRCRAVGRHPRHASPVLHARRLWLLF